MRRLFNQILLHSSAGCTQRRHLAKKSSRDSCRPMKTELSTGLVLAHVANNNWFEAVQKKIVPGFLVNFAVISLSTHNGKQFDMLT